MSLNAKNRSEKGFEMHTVVYPELVSRGVSKSHKFKGLLKVGANKFVIRVYLKKSWPGGGFPGNQKPPWIHHWHRSRQLYIERTYGVALHKNEADFTGK